MDSFLDPLIITSSCHYPLWYSDCPYFVHWHASISFSPSISFEHPLSETIKCHALFELLLYHPWNHQFFKGILNHEINILKYLKTEVWALSILITCYRISLLLGLLSDKAGKHIFFLNHEFILTPVNLTLEVSFSSSLNYICISFHSENPGSQQNQYNFLFTQF